MTAETLRLSDASRQLGIEYNVLFRAVISGRVPAERNQTGNRWLVRLWVVSVKWWKSVTSPPTTSIIL
jgi:hypothetical protein